MQNEYVVIIQKLQHAGVDFGAGLTENEFTWIEREYRIKFPLPLRQFLSEALPVTGGFYNWRDRSEENSKHIRKMLDWPLEGILFDIEHNAFWYDAWGDRPEETDAAKQLCIQEFAKIPKLIPIYSHRYIPSILGLGELPIYSVYQTDIIYYGENLYSYLEVEFLGKSQSDINFTSIPKIPFWGEVFD